MAKTKEETSRIDRGAPKCGVCGGGLGLQHQAEGLKVHPKCRYLWCPEIDKITADVANTLYWCSKIDKITRRYCREDPMDNKRMADIYEAMTKAKRTTYSDKIVTSEGLLWRNGEFVPLLEADRVAREHGFVYAEQMVKSLEKEDQKMGRTEEIRVELEELKAEVRIGEIALSLVPNTQEALRRAKERIKELEAKLKVDPYEVSEYDAPRNGMTWTAFEKDHVEATFKEFAHDMALKFGRSSSSIRHRVAAMIAKQIRPEKWAAMGRDYRGVKGERFTRL